MIAPIVSKNQIGNAIARPVGDLFDDDALLEELNMLEEDDPEQLLLAPPAVPVAHPAAPQGVDKPSAAASKVAVGYDLPLVPSNTPVNPAEVPENEVDVRALRELEASMTM